MKKLSGLMMVLFLFLLTIPAKINAQFGVTPQLPEVIGEITAYSMDDTTHSIVIDTKTFLIDQSTVIKTKLKVNSRVRVQYKEGTKEGEKVATKIFEARSDFMAFKFMLPIPKYIPPTAFSGIGMGDLSDLGKISSFGLGVQNEMRGDKNISLIFDCSFYSYDQVLALEGETVPSHLNYGSQVTLPLGARYEATTFLIRLGIKYTLLKDMNLSPWIGAGYGINIWDLNYRSYDHQISYGKAKGKVWRHYLQAGVDLKMDNFGIFTLFMEVVGPVAKYTIDDLYGEPYSSLLTVF
jgi:hypothetical protein